MDANIGTNPKSPRVALALVVLVAVAVWGCGLPFRRKARLPQPVPPVPTVSGPANTRPLEPPTKDLTYPKLPDAPPKPKPPVIVPAETQEPEPEPEEAQPDKKTRVQRTPVPAPAKSTPAEVPAQSEAAPAKPAEAAPKLGPILDDGQQRAYNAAIDAALGSTQRNLKVVRSRRNMNVRQREMIQQAETFARQAQELRQSDPAAAQSLAERALQLSQELAGSR